MRNLSEVYEGRYFKVKDEWEGDPIHGRPTGLVNISFGDDFYRNSLRCLPEQVHLLKNELDRYIKELEGDHENTRKNNTGN